MNVEIEAWAYRPAVTTTDRRAVRVGGRRPALRRVPRHRVGCPRARPPAAVRAPHPRRRPGRAVVVHDPAQARRLPPGVRRVRSRSPSPRSATTTSSAAWPTPASSATGRRSPPRVGNARAWLELDDPVGVPVGLRRRRAGAELVDRARRRCRRATPASEAMSKALKKPRLPVRRADDLLRADAVVRPGQRPRHELLPPCRGGRD